MRIAIAVLVACTAQAQTPAKWQFVEEWRVGGDTAGPHFLLDVRAIEVLRDGRIVIVEARDQQVHLLTARGQPFKTIGRRGDGPGEFRGANGALAAPNGDILINDATNRRITIISAAGDVVKTVPHRFSGLAVRWTARFAPDGKLEEVGSLVSISRESGEPRFSPMRVAWNSDYSKADTMRAATCTQYPEATEADYGYRLPGASGRGFQAWPYPFTMSLNWYLHARDGSYWVSPFPDYKTIYRVSFGTCTATATIDLRGPAIAVPASLRSERQAALRARARENPGFPMGPDPDKVRSTLPYFEAMQVDALGRLWVERLEPASAKFTEIGVTGDKRFDVYSATGALVAEVPVPAKLCTPRCGRPFTITADRVFAITFDADDVPYLVAYRIAR